MKKFMWWGPLLYGVGLLLFGASVFVIIGYKFDRIQESMDHNYELLLEIESHFEQIMDDLDIEEDQPNE